MTSPGAPRIELEQGVRAGPALFINVAGCWNARAPD